MFLDRYNQSQKITIDTIVDINIDNTKKPVETIKSSGIMDFKSINYNFQLNQAN